MQQLYQTLEDKFGAQAWYSSITLVHDAAGDDMVTIERSVNPAKAQQEQWIWFHGFWEKKADIELQCSGVTPRELLFQLHKDSGMQQLGNLVKQAMQELSADPANGRSTLVMAGMQVDDDLSPEGLHEVFYVVQLRTGAGINRNFRYNARGEKLLPPGAL